MRFLTYAARTVCIVIVLSALVAIVAPDEDMPLYGSVFIGAIAAGAAWRDE